MGVDNQSKFERVVDSLHEAMLDDGRLPEASRLIDEACGSVGNNIIVYRGDTQADFEWLFAKLHYRGELNEEINQVYPDHYQAIDERLPRLMRLPDGQPIAVPEIYSSRELRTSATYNELLDMASGQRGLNIRMERGLTDGTRMFFVLADPIDPNGWGTDQLNMLQRILPHLRQYVRVRQALAGDGSASVRASIATLLASTAVGVILLDRRGAIIEANSRASQLLHEGDGLLVKHGLLGCLHSSDNTKLGEILGQVLPSAAGKPVSGSMAVKRSFDGPKLALHVIPLESPRWDFGVRSPSAILLITDPWRRPRIDPGLVSERLGVTISESGVAAALAEGRGIREIAESTRRKESSVRWLVKQLHAKLGVVRQSDLVRLVLAASQFGDSHS